MKRIAPFLLLVMLAGVAIYLRSRLDTDDRRAKKEESRAPPDAPVTPASASANVPQSAQASPPDARKPATEPMRIAQPAAPEKKPDADAKLFGRFLLPDGSPASGVHLKVNGWGANSERVTRYGEPEEWKDVEATSDADGTFTISFDPPRAFQFILDTEFAGYAKASWRWPEIEPGSSKYLGDVTLRRTGTIKGRIVNERGDPVCGVDWQVYGEAASNTSGDGADATRVTTSADPKTAAFELLDAPTGSVSLTADSSLSNWISGPTVEVRPGEETRADIVYQGKDLSHRITLTLFSRPFYIFEVAEDVDIQLTGGGIETRHAHKIEGSSQSHCFDDVPPGRYTVEIRDDKFVPWQRDGVAPGTEISARLVGNASVKLDVVDDATNQPVPLYSLTVLFDDSDTRPNSFQILDARSAAPADGIFAGMIPVNQTLIVKSDGYAECSLPIHPLQPDQVTSVVARLSHGATLRGVVWRSNHATRSPNVPIRLFARREKEAEERASINSEVEPFREANSDSQGEFEFTAIPAGHYSIHAGDDSILEAVLDDVEVKPESKEIAGLELVLPASGYLSGSLVGPDGANYAGFQITVIPSVGDEADRWKWMMKQHRAGFMSLESDGPESVHADGTFRVGPFPPGEATVALQFPSVTVTEGRNMRMSSPGPAITLGSVTILAEGDATAVFDVRDRFPGSVIASVSVNGQAAIGAIVELRQSNPDQLVAIAETGPDGIARLSPVPIGSAHALVRSVERSWAFWPQDELTIAAAKEISVAFTATLTDGTLQVTGRASGAPLASRWFSIGGEGAAASDVAIRVQSDATGTIRLRLAPGRYRLIDQESADDLSTPFEWSLLGPTSRILSLEE